MKITFRNICEALLTASLCFLIVEAGLFFKSAKTQFTSLVSDTQTTLSKANVVLDNASAVEDKISAASDQQTTYFKNTQTQMYKVVTDIKSLIVHLDLDVHNGLVPRLESSLDAATSLETTAAKNLTDTTNHVNSVIDDLRPGIDSATLALQPMPEIVNNFATSTDNLKTATAEGAASMVTIHKGVDYEVGQLTKPVKKIKAITLFILTGLGKFLGI